ncbi:MAG: cell division protein FtsH [Candidatus Staskawiczbacteria bacterium RIFOXYC1_FULL_37_43]|nr:MAG: cell division protein FtsH [Candidatus Staskawiczbacteria bacterium RIFCSPHIGHO2_01_FULL_37_17]OGZ71526.1 MAG: cell division protein FtsH [Candidatus Staskawiczbacteria bacterium RIFCSPLOWO2_01_FULL_37_19]OGZ76282.1 MAG: cell division protein FtsH [Candidatus Staskawiczbacteria bacterium RIFOXYA1_FULL_37_15]OGZ76993.1 MAG: cell division protein FtsH [Candidatus Staskawiczbacteria bacterium RIFOXYA12_FULL_37_10]OGZ80297.1 MAG: cell division protein FtsH [Candidatus Staskawiczbacteria bac
MNPLLKNFILVVFILLLIGAIFSFLYYPSSPVNQISLTQLVADINQNKIKKIITNGDSLSITYIDETGAESMKESGVGIAESLDNLGANKDNLQKIEINIQPAEEDLWSWLTPVLIFGILPLVVFGWFFWMMLRQAKTGAMQAFDFTKARARIFGAEGHGKEKITFKDVAGLKEAKEELVEIVDFLKFPKKYLAMGAKIPRGVLLLGSAGIGKTLLARAVAGEANVPFFSISGSEFVEMFVGVGSARVRDLFSTAKRSAPSIIFIDELDAIGRHRGAGIGGGHDEREQTLNQILVEMDGFERETNVIIMAATNRGDILDPALLRPGRFDRKIILDPPDVNDREEILRIHSKEKPLDKDVNFREIAERTPGFSGADLANVANEAALLAARINKTQINQKEFLEAIEKVLLGPERKSHILSKKEKEIAAFHEAGHALVSAFSPETEPVRKISIIARGMAAGYTLQMPSEERKMKTKKGFISEIATLLGGYTAEKIKFGEMTTGASNDLSRASELARKLVKEYGMSSLGPISFGEKEEMIFLGKEISEQRNYSEKVAEKIDKEVDMIIKEAQQQAVAILSKRKALLEKVAKRLVEKEIIEREEFEKLIK